MHKLGTSNVIEFNNYIWDIDGKNGFPAYIN